MSRAALSLVPVVMRDQRVTPTGKLVFYVLAKTHDQETGDCNLSLGALERETGCSRNAVIKGIESLEKARHLKKRHRFKRTSERRENIPNSYTILGLPKGGSAVSEPPSSVGKKASGDSAISGPGVVRKLHPSTVRAPTRPNALAAPIDDHPILVEDLFDYGEELGEGFSGPRPQNSVARSKAAASPETSIEEVEPGPAAFSLADWQREADDPMNPDAW